MPINVYIADDHKIVRDGLKALLATHSPKWEVVGEADNGQDAVRDIRALSPDIVLIDIAMPLLNGIDAVRSIIAERPACRIIALSMYRSREFVAGMLQAGARGYVLKDSAFLELADAIETVSAGRVYLGKEIADIVVDEYRRGRSQFRDIGTGPLSDREREVLQLLAEGRTTREIAEKLSLSPKTVETHRSQIIRKLGTSSIAKLTKYAIRQGLTTAGE